MGRAQDVAAAVEDFRRPGATWPPPPAGGWKHLPLSLVDTVFSLRAHYSRGDRTFEPVRLYATWVETQRGLAPGSLAVPIASEDGSTVHELSEMVALLEPLTTAQRVELFGNKRPAHTGQGAPRRADSVLTAATSLRSIGIETRQDFVAALSDPDRKARLRSTWMSVPGFGERSWEYIPLLCGLPGVKADVHVTSFVAEAISSPVTPEQARKLVLEAVEILERHHPELRWDIGGVEHLIWRVRSGQEPL